MNMTEVVTRATEIPAVREAAAFAPTARNRNPHVLRLSSHQIAAAAKSAMINPKFARNSEPKRCGRRALIFTSGATEGDNLAIKGVYEMYASKGNHIITCTTEHKAVIDTCKHLEKLGAEVTYL
jgi:cysteine sulfinate desulfinase/cysteine desulfurase-like protein